MKKLLLSVLLLISGLTFSQKLKIEKVRNVDSMLINVDKSGFDSNILYDRTAQLSNLKNFNTETSNIATVNLFEQALQDLYKSSNQTLFVSYDVARKSYPDKGQFNKVAIGGINARFHSLNYDEKNAEDGGLVFENNILTSIEGKKAFNENHVLMFAPMEDYAMGKVINFIFKKDLFFQESDNLIKTIDVDFGTGTFYEVYNNGTITNSEIPIKYEHDGYKKLTFKVVFMDNKTITTYGKLHVKLPITNQERTTPLIENVIGFNSTIPFQGYDEGSSKYGKLDYRIFYHTNNGNTQNILKKPIIILDGFDPGDGRKIQDSDSPKPADMHTSIEEMMVYGPNKTKMIPELRNLGFDVVVVNFPTYTTSGVEIDGGADFIERNALTVVTLIKSINNRLASGGRMDLDNRLDLSTRQTKLVIVGPSMGGQISRYALSYMEKKYQQTNDVDWRHNTRLWISVDSPHLGANIPMGVQCLLNVLKDNTDSVGAADFVNNWLGSAAAKQQLIEQYSGQEHVGPFPTTTIKSDYLDGKTVSQGFSVNRGHPFFIQYYNNLFNNGLANSKGYPQQARSIAIVNGSLLGNRNYDNPYVALGTDLSGTVQADNYADHGAKVFKVEGDANIIGHIVTLETYFMASTNNNHKLAYFKKKKIGGWDYYDRYGTNINSRGNMDNISGGWFPAQRDLAQSVLAESPGEAILGDITNWSIVVNDWHVNNLEHVSSFIPTMSSLGFKNPNTSWTQNLRRNLVCTNEIPFDSYFGPDKNEPHTSFTQKSYDWLKEELAGHPQQPNFQVNSSKLIGQLCSGTGTFTFENCSTPGSVQTWLTSSNLQTVSSNGNSITVQATANYHGEGWIKATFANGVTVTKTFWIGKPHFTLHLDNDPELYNWAYFELQGINSNIHDQEISHIEWTKVGGTGSLYAGDNDYDGSAQGPGNTWLMHIKIEITNSCGTTTKFYDITPPPPGDPCDRPATFDIKGFDNDLYKVVANRNPDPCEKSSNSKMDDIESHQVSMKVYDFTGMLLATSNNEEIDLSRFNSGIYIIKAFVDDKIILTKKIGK